MKTSIYIKISVITIINLIFTIPLHSQCGCLGGAAIGSASIVGGTSNIGVLPKHNIRLLSSLIYSNGDQYYSGSKKSSPSEEGMVLDYNATYTGLLIGYGISDRLTVDVEIGAFINKMQNFGTYKLSGGGLSHATVYGKYALYKNDAKSFQWTAGLGVKLPLSMKNQDLPQNIKSSTGAFGGVLLSYLHTNFDQSDWNFILINRAEFNDKNNSEIRIGASFINSLFLSREIFDDFIGIMELRSDIKLMDKFIDEDVCSSGWNTIVISPQVNYTLGDFNFSLFYDIPVYKYYNDSQLTNKQNIGLSINWQTSIF